MINNMIIVPSRSLYPPTIIIVSLLAAFLYGTLIALNPARPTRPDSTV